MSSRTTTSDTCQLQCVDNDRQMLAEVLDFRPNNYLSVSVLRKVKIQMKYNEITHVYEGKMGGLTFVTTGPVLTTFKQGR